MNSIEARSTFDVPTMARGRYWHWRKRPWLVFVMPALGLVLIGCAIMLLRECSPSVAQAIFFLVCGVLFLFRYWIVGFRFRRLIRKHPRHGMELTWKFSPEALEGHSSDSEFRTAWTAYHETVTTPEGFLIYPQKNIYFWIPRSAFASSDDFLAVAGWLGKTTKNLRISRAAVSGS